MYKIIYASLQERPASLALISIEREFLPAGVKNEVVQIFSDRKAHTGKRNGKVQMSKICSHHHKF